MLIEQMIEFYFRWPGPPGRTSCTPTTGSLHDKTKICNENFRELKYCRRQYALLLPTWTKSLIIKILHHNARF